MSHEFGPQGEAWLKEMSNRADPLSPASLQTFRVHIKRLSKFIPADTPLSIIHNGFVRDLVSKMSALGAKTVKETLATLRAIVASVLDPTTLEPVYPRVWNHKAIGARKVRMQRQPTVTARQVEAAISRATSYSEQMLYVILGGTGLRRSEVRSVRMGPVNDLNLSCWLPEQSLIRVRSTMYGNAELSGHTKTDSGQRNVDVCQTLNDAIKAFVLAEKISPGMFLFGNKNGQPLSAGVLAKKANHRGIGGLHALRRFRITHLRSVPVIEDLIRFWAGHSADGITSRYSKVSEDLALRRSWASRAGLGFSLEKVGRPAKAKLGRPLKPRKLRTGPTSVHVPVQEPAVTNLPPREPEQFEPVIPKVVSDFSESEPSPESLVELEKMRAQLEALR